MTLLLTGASGYVGSRVAIHLDAAGVQWEKLSCRLEKLNPGSLSHEIVIHCAGALRRRTDQLVSANVEGTAALAEAVPEGARIIFVSSRSVYPCNGHRLVHEGDSENPWDDYGASKLAAERILRASRHRVAIVRAGGVFGHPHRTGNFLDRAVDLALAGQSIDLATPSRQEDYVAVDWLAEVLVHAALEGTLDGETVHAAGHARNLDDILYAMDRALRAVAGRSATINRRDLPIPTTPVLAPGRILHMPEFPPQPADPDVFAGMIRARMELAR
jgi:nucleoside-diphosphate-sugar epimerase